MKFTNGVIVLFTASAHIQQADAFSWGGLPSLFGEVGNTFVEGVDLGIDITEEALTDLASGSFDLDSTLNKIGDAVEDQVKEDLAELTEDGRVFVDATIDLGQTLAGSVVYVC
eukprot:Pgem_evm1s9057